MNLAGCDPWGNRRPPSIGPGPRPRYMPDATHGAFPTGRDRPPKHFRAAMPLLPRPDTLLRELHTLRGDTTPPGLARRRELLRAVNHLPLGRARDVESLHEEALFLAAFPPSRPLLTLAHAILRNIHRKVADLRPSEAAALDDSGIAGSTTTTTIPFEFACWLRRHGQRADFVVPDEATAGKLDPLVRLTMFPAECDAFDSGEYSSREWLRLASAGLGSSFDWLVPAHRTRAPRAYRTAFEDAEPNVRWQLGTSPFSVSRNRAPAPSTHWRADFRRVPADPVAWIAQPLHAWRRLSGTAARRWIDASIAALGARAREVTPTMDPNIDEVYLADLGEGAALCIIGAHPEKRLSLEANYGYVMFSNGVPIGYGGVTPLADQANTGANLFPAFRGSEAAFLFGQALRAFRGIFGISRFVVNPYQFGKGNDEALQSGAFWFYDRLGFRSASATLRRTVDRERLRLRATPGARTSLTMLRRIATADVVLELAPSATPLFDEQGLISLGHLVATSLAARPATDRTTWRFLDVLPRHTRARGELLLGPVVALIAPAVARWSPEDRRALASLIRAKGAVRERGFARLSRTHATLWTALRSRATSRRGRAARS